MIIHVFMQNLVVVLLVLVTSWNTLTWCSAMP
jgi:hypothetical protein